MENKGKQPVHAGVGTTSIIMIFLVLCLTAFGVLSLTAARSSENITQKNIDYVCDYYNTSAFAQEMIALADGEGSYSLSLSFGDGMVLECDYTVTSEGYKITRYTAVSEADMDEFMEFEEF